MSPDDSVPTSPPPPPVEGDAERATAQQAQKPPSASKALAGPAADETDFSGLDDDDGLDEEVTASGLKPEAQDALLAESVARLAASVQAPSPPATTAPVPVKSPSAAPTATALPLAEEDEGDDKPREDRPTLVPEIDLEALAKLGPEAFSHKHAPPPADLFGLDAPTTDTDMFELDAIDAPHAQNTHPTQQFAAVKVPVESTPSAEPEERPTSRPPSEPLAAARRASPTPSLASQPPSQRASVRAGSLNFDELDAPDDLDAGLTEPPPEANPTEAPPMRLSLAARMGMDLESRIGEHEEAEADAKSVDDMFAEMIDEPFPPSLDSAAIPVPEPSNDEVYDADADEAMATLRERFEAKDYPTALQLAETLAGDLLHAEEVAEIAARCKSALQARYVERIGSLTKVPIIAVSMNVIRDLPIDNRAGFILSRIDGLSSLEMILDMCGMSELDALRIVYDLVQNGALEFV